MDTKERLLALDPDQVRIFVGIYGFIFCELTFDRRHALYRFDDELQRPTQLIGVPLTKEHPGYLADLEVCLQDVMRIRPIFQTMENLLTRLETVKVSQEQFELWAV